MKTLGIIILIIGILLGLYALNMDTSVEVNYASGNSFGLPERVNNIGLMNDKQNYLIFSGILSALGLVIILVTKGKNEGHDMPEFKVNIDIAKKAEYKGQIDIAIDKYLDALYCLENYKNKLSKKENESRIKLIFILKIKVEKLKSKNNIDKME